MSDQDRADFDAAFVSEDIQTVRIVDELYKLGCTVSETTVRRHRRGACACGR